MMVVNPIKIVVVMSLALLLALSLVSGAVAGEVESLQAARSVQDAGDEGLAVTITRVDSAAFPQVDAYVAVSGADGLPLQGLAVKDFTVREDADPIPGGSITVVEDNTQSFRLVLALDVSTGDAEWTRIQEGAKAFIETLGPQDQLAILTFHDEVEIDQDFTNDARVLNATINGLGTQGDFTVLNEAVVRAATMAAELDAAQPGRRVVVILTDSRDNVGNVSITDALDQVQELGVPIYTIGFGNKIRAQDLEKIAGATRGRSFRLDGPDDVTATLAEIGDLLRQGYKVTFASGSQADNQEHELSIGVSYADQVGQTQGRFEALPGEVTVTMPELAAGQTVGGVINLTAQVTAPAPVASVEYLLDGRSLAQWDTAPYGFEWDSAQVELGAHVLSVKATDGAGNQGQAEVSLNVVSPVVVIAAVSRDEVQLGSEVVVQAQVDALAPAQVTVVELLLDGETLEVDSTAPFGFSFDSAAHAAGAHVVTVRAEDSLGRVGQTDLNVRFVAPPAPLPTPQPEPETSTTPSWLEILVSGIVGAILIVALAALVFLFGGRKTRYQRAFRLEIANQGNVASRYELQAQDPADTFEFAFALDGESLQQRPASTTMETVEPLPVGTLPPAQTAVPADVADEATPGRLEGVREVAGKATGAGGFLAGLLSTLGTLLPGSAGRSASRAGSRLRQGQARTWRARQLAGRVSSARPSTAPARPARDEAAPALARDAERGAAVLARAWAQTPTIGPGECLAVDLLVNPIRSYHSQSYSFTLLSRSVEQRDAPVVTDEVNVPMVRPSWLRRLFPYLIILLTMAVTIGLYIVFLTNGESLG